MAANSKKEPKKDGAFILTAPSSLPLSLSIKNRRALVWDLQS